MNMATRLTVRTHGAKLRAMHPIVKAGIAIFALIGAWTTLSWFLDLSAIGKLFAIGATIGATAIVGWLHDRGTSERDRRIEEENGRIRDALDRGEYDWQQTDD